MKQEFEAAAADFLKSEQGKKLKSFAGSAQGQQLRNQYAQKGESILSAINRGDMQTAEGLLKGFLESEDGKKLAEQLKNIMK